MAKIGLVNDVIFKAVFGREENKYILTCLINALLDFRGDDKITDITILNPFIDRKFPEDKLVILDIKARDGRGKLFNIEVQINPPKSYINRVVLYLSKLFSEQMNIGDEYSDLSKTIGISVIDSGVIFKNTKELHNIFRLKNINSGDELTDILELHFIELDKFNIEKPFELKTRFERWLHLLKFSELYTEINHEIPVELREEEGVTMTLEAYQKANSDNYLRQLIWERERASFDRKMDLFDAREEGKLEGKIDIVRTMLQKGLNIKDILEFTGLEEKDISFLKE